VIGVEKRRVARERKIPFSKGGGGTNTVFRPKYRALRHIVVSIKRSAPGQTNAKEYVY
jgi:hypothetical protein